MKTIITFGEMMDAAEGAGGGEKMVEDATVPGGVIVNLVSYSAIVFTIGLFSSGM